MSKLSPRVSRRQFLGSSAAVAAVGLAPGSFAATQTAVPALPVRELAPSGPIDEAYWWKVRSQFNMIDGFTFMNNGTLGPVPRVVIDENDRIYRELCEDPTNGYRTEDLDVVREKLANFVGATADETAYTRSTTEGMNIFAHGVDWREGDEIIMNRHEHPGGYKAYKTLEKRRGIKIHWIDVPSPPESPGQIIELYEKAITPRTRAIVVSEITYVTGLLTPAKELTDLAHRKGLLISVDGAHTVGMIDVDFQRIGCDHYAAAGQKFLLSGTGTGFACFKQDIQDQIWPLMGYADPENERERTARRYEQCGQRQIPSALGMAAGVEFQEVIGKKNVEARVRQLSARLKEGLQETPGVKLWTSMDPKLSAGLTLFSIRDVPMENTQKGLLERDRIYIRTMADGNLNGCRASMHIYVMLEDVDRLLAGIRHIAFNWADYMAKPETS